jgi:hypothetical protein
MMKHHGMNLDQIAATAAFVDENFDDWIDKAGDIARAHGGTEDEIEAMRELQREWLAQDRKELRAWLERGGETLQ